MQTETLALSIADMLKICHKINEMMWLTWREDNTIFFIILMLYTKALNQTSNDASYNKTTEIAAWEIIEKVSQENSMLRK